MPSDDLHATDGFSGLSVVVPVAPGDESWRILVACLATVPGAEVIFSATEALAATDRDLVLAELPPGSWTWLTGSPGRARQLNAGGRAARREHVWFLHADSRFAAETVSALRAALRSNGDALHYFDLAFLPDGPSTMALNARGVRWRSRWLGMPFGDQGLCIRRATWEALGGFDESAPYGEDHLFVWRARRAGVRLRPAGGRLLTSARRYRERGWARTTLRHVWLTARQAAPEALALLGQHVRGVFRTNDARDA